MRRVAMLLLLLFAAGGAAAQEALVQCSPRRADAGAPGSGFMTLPRLAEHLRSAAPAMKVDEVRQTAMAVPTLFFFASRPDGIPDPKEWRSTWFEVVLHPAGRTLHPGRMVIGRVVPPAPGDSRTPITAEFPDLDAGWWPARYDVYVLACMDAGQDPSSRRANTNEIRAYGQQTLYVSSLKLSATAGIAAVLGLYLALAFAAARVQGRQFAHAREAARRAGGDLSRAAFALRPTVIMQDAFGHCSLSRFQVLLFTLVLTGVYAYVMARTGELPDVSPSVLLLLGITLAGSTLARAVDGPVVDTPNRLWLLGTGVIDPTPRLPQWRDLLAGDGEIDVTRVQALVFTLFAAVALVVNGTANLEQFRIPDQIVQLMGISQAVYVAGKALPREAATRLNAEIRALREAENAALAAPADPAAQRAFETARNGVGSVLFDVFGERFDDTALRRLTPGLRRTSPPAVEPA